MSLQEKVTIIKDAVTILAAVVGMFVAVAGLRTWHRQLYGQSRFELAKKLALAIRLFREELIYFRQIMDSSGEVQAAWDHYKLPKPERGQKESIEHSMALKNWKFERLTAKWNDVATISLEAELVLGDQVGALILDCRKIMNDISNALTVQSLSLQYPTSGIDTESPIRILYGQSTDEFGTGAERRIKALLEALMPNLEPRRKSLDERKFKNLPKSKKAKDKADTGSQDAI